ncbi:hypothetical protein EIK77_001178 [Talaromyces pinophilus]|nr:hypothetical protein EIK77_001178 [Talaromyces pinophilus]
MPSHRGDNYIDSRLERTRCPDQLISEATSILMAKRLNHAIVYGASGLIGWAVVNQLLKSYPDAGAFSKVTAVTNRPLKPSETYWPEWTSQRPDLELVSGIDIGQEDELSVVHALKSKIEDIETITHVFYLGMHAPTTHYFIWLEDAES